MENLNLNFFFKSLVNQIKYCFNYCFFAKVHNFIFCFIFSGALISCVSISSSTVELSSKVGDRITEMEKLHQEAIQRYFDVEEQKIKDFLRNTWEPLFLKNFIGISGVQDKINTASRLDYHLRDNIKLALQEYFKEDEIVFEDAFDQIISKLEDNRTLEKNIINDVLKEHLQGEELEIAVSHIGSLLSTDEVAQIIFEFAEAAHLEMKNQQEQLLAPIEKARILVSAELSASYADLIRGQSIITGRLEASRRKSEQQESLLGLIGANDHFNNISNRLIGISDGVDNFLNQTNELIGQENGSLENSESLIKLLLNSLEPDK